MHLPKLITLPVVLLLGAFTALPALAADIDLDNLTLANLQDELSSGARNVASAIQVAGEDVADLQSRLFVSDFLNVINSVRLDGLGYAALADDHADGWNGELTYQVQWDARKGSLDFGQGGRLALGYSAQLNDALEVGFKMLGGIGDLPGDSTFGFTDPELEDSVTVDQSWVKVSAD